MKEAAKPSSSAASPVGDLRVEAPEPNVPRAPGLSSLFAIAVSGIGTLGATMMVGVCVMAPYFIPFSRGREFAQYLIFASFAAGILFLAARYWRDALRRTDRAGERWIGLSLPAFVVGGIILAVVFPRTSETGAPAPSSTVSCVRLHPITSTRRRPIASPRPPLAKTSSSQTPGRFPPSTVTWWDAWSARS